MPQIKRRFLPYAYVLPSLVFLVALVIYPLGFSLYYSFQNWTLQTSPVPMGFIGFQNYVNAFKNPTFLHSLVNTIRLSISATAIEFVLGLGIAVLLSVNLRGSSLVRSLLIMPTTVAPIVVGFIFRFLYYKDGLITFFLESVGIPIPAEGILGSTSTAMWGVIFTDAWEWTPFFAIILLAGLQSIPDEIIEAARVDGASFFRIFWHIMLPHLRFVSAIILMIRFMQTFNLFDIIYVETMGGPGTATRTLSYNLFYEGLVNYNIGSSTAIAWIMILIILVLVNLFIHFAFQGREI
jgi:multiple sugar transport system permease protein